MKTNFTKLLALCGVILLVISACKKDQIKTVATAGKPGDLTASASTLVLDKSKFADTAAVINFSFSSADYGYKAAVTNILEIDADGDNWANPTSVTLPANTLKKGYSTADFNNIILKLNLPGGSAAKVNVRIQHSISGAVTPVFSNTVALTVTPFNLTSFLYVVGAYQGWNASAPDSILSATSNGVYTGVFDFTAGNNQFLILPQKNKYDNKYATNDPQNTTSSTVAQNGPNNFYAPFAATVDPNVNITSNMVTLDINKNTITFVPTSWGVVGSATPGSWPAGSGFQDDIDMHFNNATQTWSVVATLTGGNQIKFRKNHAWDTNYGSVTTPGVLDTDNNNNITIPTTGSYLITIDIAHLTYSLVKQ